MPGLTRALPTPRVLSLGGQDWLVSELRLRDIAILEAWVEARTPWPTDLLPERDDTDAPTWSRLLDAAYNAAERWPPRFGDARCTALLNTQDGLAFFVWVAIQRDQPGATIEDARGLVARMGATDWKLLARVLFGGDPMEELLRLMEEGGGAPDRPPVDWEKAVHEVAEMLGITYEAVGEMTLSQFAIARRRGEPLDHGTDVSHLSPEEIAELGRQRAARWKGGA